MKKCPFWGRYSSIIFDFDGVILDSNNVKRDAIKNALSDVLSFNKITECVSYFVRYNGVPRRQKIEKFVPELLVDKVLIRYEAQLKIALLNAPLMPGVRNFIRRLVENRGSQQEIFILSGGETDEIENLLCHHGLNEFFDGVFAAPYRKEENLKRIGPQFPVLFFGDSLVDYEVAREFGLDFIFVYGATNVANWRSEIKPNHQVSIIRDFEEEIKLC